MAELCTMSEEEARNEDCTLCCQPKEAHLPTKICQLCYREVIGNWFVKDACENGQNCESCSECFKNNVTNQFARRFTDFKCICNPQSRISEERLREYLTI